MPSDARRATRACLSCRSKKTKCFFINNDSFACSRCLSLNRICSFQEELIKLGKFSSIDQVLEYEKTQLGKSSSNEGSNNSGNNDNSGGSSTSAQNAAAARSGIYSSSANIDKMASRNSSNPESQSPFNINDLLTLGSPLDNSNSSFAGVFASSSNAKKLNEIHADIKQLLQILTSQNANLNAADRSQRSIRNRSAASTQASSLNLYPGTNGSIANSSNNNYVSNNTPTNMLPLSFITSPFNILKESPNSTYLPFPIQNLIKPIIFDSVSDSNIPGVTNNSPNNLHKPGEESIVLKIISYSEYLQILNIFQRYYGKWISLNDNYSSMELLNTLRIENPVLLDIITYLILTRHNSHSSNNNNVTSPIFTKLSLNESLIVSKISQFVSSQILNNTIALSLENISNLTLLSVFGYTLSKSSPSFFSLNIDPWLYSGLALKHFISSINYNPKFLDFTLNISTPTSAAAAAAAAAAASSSQHHNQSDKGATNAANKDPLSAEFDILTYMRNHDHLLVTHLFNCIISGRSCSIDLSRMSKIRIKLDNIYAGTFDGKMTAEIYLCDIIYQYLLKEDSMCVEQVVKSQFSDVQRCLSQWSDDWNYLIVQPIPQLLEFMFNFYQILIHYHYMFQSTFFQCNNTNTTDDTENAEFSTVDISDASTGRTATAETATTIGEYEWQKSIYFDPDASPPQPSPLFTEMIKSSTGSTSTIAPSYPTLKMVILKTKNDKLLIRMLRHCFAAIDEIIKFIDRSSINIPKSDSTVKNQTSPNKNAGRDAGINGVADSSNNNAVDAPDASGNTSFIIDLSDVSEQFQYASDMIHLSVFMACIFSMNIISCYFEREAACKFARMKKSKKGKKKNNYNYNYNEEDGEGQRKRARLDASVSSSDMPASASESATSMAAKMKKEYVEYFNLHGDRVSKINFSRSLNKYLVNEYYEFDEDAEGDYYFDDYDDSSQSGKKEEFKITKRQFVKYLNCLLLIIVEFERCSCVKSLECNLFYRYCLTLKDHLRDMFPGLEMY